MSKEISTCGVCEYFKSEHGNGDHACYLAPPVPHGVMSQGVGGPQLSILALRAPVKRDTPSCGGFQRCYGGE